MACAQSKHIWQTQNLWPCFNSTRLKLAQISLLLKTLLTSHPKECPQTAHSTSSWTAPCTAPCRQNTRKWWQLSNIHQVHTIYQQRLILSYKACATIAASSFRLKHQPKPQIILWHACLASDVGMPESSADNAWIAKTTYRFTRDSVLWCLNVLF